MDKKWLKLQSSSTHKHCLLLSWQAKKYSQSETRRIMMDNRWIVPEKFFSVKENAMGLHSLCLCKYGYCIKRERKRIDAVKCNPIKKRRKKKNERRKKDRMSEGKGTSLMLTLWKLKSEKVFFLVSPSMSVSQKNRKKEKKELNVCRFWERRRIKNREKKEWKWWKESKQAKAKALEKVRNKTGIIWNERDFFLFSLTDLISHGVPIHIGLYMDYYDGWSSTSPIFFFRFFYSLVNCEKEK